MNDHGKMVSWYFINRYCTRNTKKQKLKFVREIFNLNHHLRKSNLYKIVNNGMSHFQTEFESMGRKEALRKSVDTRSSFVLTFFKEDKEDTEEGDEEEEDMEEGDVEKGEGQD